MTEYNNNKKKSDRNQTAETEAAENAVLWYTSDRKCLCLMYYLCESSSVFTVDSDTAWVSWQLYSLHMDENLSVDKNQSGVEGVGKQISATFAEIASLPPPKSTWISPWCALRWPPPLCLWIPADIEDLKL